MFLKPCVLNLISPEHHTFLDEEICLSPVGVVCWHLKGAPCTPEGIADQGGSHCHAKRGLTSPSEALSGSKPQKSLHEMHLLFVLNILRSETKNSLFSPVLLSQRQNTIVRNVERTTLESR